MLIFYLIIFSIPVCNIYFGLWIHKNLKPFPKLRKFLLAYAVFQLILFIALLFFRSVHPFPRGIAALLYIWSIVVLPVTIVILFTGRSLLFIIQKIVRRPTPPATNTGNPTRRQFLAAATAIVPPIAAFGLAGAGLAQYSRFRTRSFMLQIPNLPSNLDGLTIAHVSDLHIGNFVDSRVINKVVETVNNLRPDLVCFTGDLVDTLLTDLPSGLDMFRKFDPRFGLFLCEGNHDLFQSREEFTQRVKSAGFNLLANEALTLRVRNEPVQILGLAWGPIHSPQQTAITEHAQKTLSLLNPQAFPILLAHHPHAFDYAIEKNIPLTLSGHTHGGQIMLTQNIGPGPLMYKYYSGLYQRESSSLVVSNGVGNWFPLRVNAPAEIVHITLKRS